MNYANLAQPDDFASIDITHRVGSKIAVRADTLLSGAHSLRIHQLLEERGVLVFPKIGLDEEQQQRVSKTLGQIVPLFGQEIQRISFDEDPDGPVPKYLGGTFTWHMDFAGGVVPDRTSLLSARKLSHIGGNFEFASTYAAWEDLPESDKSALERLTVEHRAWSTMVLPLVWTHKSGRKSLVLGTTAIRVRGMNLKDSRRLLQQLHDWVTQPQFVFIHKWSIGDLLMWDNTGGVHRVDPYPPDSGRLMIRTTLAGVEALIAAELT